MLDPTQIWIKDINERQYTNLNNWDQERVIMREEDEPLLGQDG